MSNYKAYRGSINNLLLNALLSGDKYGYEIIKEIESSTKGAIKLKQPSLYSSLRRMEEQGLITSYWQDSEIGGRRHYYKLTDKGKSYKNKNLEDNFQLDDEEINHEENSQITIKNNEQALEEKNNNNITSTTTSSQQEPTYVVAKQENLFNIDTYKIPQIEENDISYVQYDLFNEQQSILRNNTKTNYDEPKLYVNKFEQFDNHNSSIQPIQKTIPTVSKSPTPIISSDSEDVEKEKLEEDSLNLVEQIEKTQQNNKNYGDDLPTLDINFESLFGGWNKKTDNNMSKQQIDEDSVEKDYNEEESGKYITEFDDVSANQPAVENNVYLRPSGDENIEKPEEPALNKYNVSNKKSDYIINKRIKAAPKDYKDVLENLYSLKNEENNISNDDELTDNQIDLNKTLNSEGIKINYYSKFNEKNKYNGQFICYNKIKFINSWICYGISLLIIWLTYTILVNTTNMPHSHLNFYVIATSLLAIYPVVYTIIYLANPDKKIESHYNLRLGIINSLLAILGSILIILSINIFAGMNSLNQLDFITYWLLPSLLTILFLGETIFYFILTKSRKFRN